MEMNIANSNRRGLYILAIYLKDAFGSVSHKLLENNLKLLNLPEAVRNVIINSYDDASVQITTIKGKTEDIQIKKGVKQGCSLSSALINACIDPLVRRLNSSDMKQYGVALDENEQNNFKIQPFSDVIRLFANSYESLDVLMNVLYDFLNLAKIQLNPLKCEVFRNKYVNDEVEAVTMIDPLTNESRDLPVNDSNAIIKYLGARFLRKSFERCSLLMAY
jgi:hypothetical protein